MREQVDSSKNSSIDLQSRGKKKESIVYRTRSKLSLNDTPLETIEQSFAPPDITHDMYETPDINEDLDDNWINFLIDFTQPLEKVINGDDDPIADPDFKVLEEESIAKNNKHNNEQKILLPANTSANSVTNLLVQSTHIQNSLYNPLQFNIVPVNSNPTNSVEFKLVPNNIIPISSFSINTIPITNFTLNNFQTSNIPINAVPLSKINLNTVPSNSITNNVPLVSTVPANTVSNTDKKNQNKKNNKKINSSTSVQDNDTLSAEEDNDDENTIPKMTLTQINLLHVQMTQHVQLLAQQFVMTYKHPTLHKFSNKCKQNLMDLQSQSKGDNSPFNPINLSSAIKLINDWELNFENEEFHKNYMSKLQENVDKEKDYSNRRRKYICKIPNEIFKICVESKCLIHPHLLPRVYPASEYIPRQPYLKSEINLIALGLEQFIPFVKENKKSLFNSDYNKYVDAIQLIITYMLPARDVNGLINCVKKLRNSKKDNPVRRYYQTGSAPKAIHCFLPIKDLVPPKSQPLETLPNVWQDYITNHVQYSIDNYVKFPTKTIPTIVQPQIKQEVIEERMEIENPEFIVPEILDPDNLPSNICKNMPILNTTPEKQAEFLTDDATIVIANNTSSENLSLRRSERLKKKPVIDTIKTENIIDDVNNENLCPENYEENNLIQVEKASILKKSDHQKEYLRNSYKKKLKIQLSPKFKASKKFLPKKKLKQSAKILTSNQKNQSDLNTTLTDEDDDDFDISSDELLNTSSSSSESLSESELEEGTPISINNTEFPSESDSLNSSFENLEQYKPWSKEEDKILLESIKEDYSEESFLNISIILQDRSLDEVKRRSEYLLSLIQKMQSKM